MDAKELTKRYHDMENRVIHLERENEYLRQEFEKQRLIIDDMKTDVKMLTSRPNKAGGDVIKRMYYQG